MMLLGNHLNYYASYLGELKYSIIPLIFNYFSPKVSIPKEDEKIIRELSRKGTVIYAQKNRSSLDFLFFNHKYKVEGLPYPIFGNYINMIWWQPIKSVFRIFLSKLYCLIDGTASPNPYRTDYVRRMSEEGLSSILFLRHPTGLLKRFALKEKDDPMVYLLSAQKVMKKTIYIIPHMIVYHKHPTKERRNMIDILFGPKEEPGLIRRIIIFLSYYRRAFIKIGDPVNLREFLEDKGPNVDGELSYDLRRTLLENIERESRLIIGPVLKKRLDLIEMVLWDDDFMEKVRRISIETGEPIEKLRRRAVEQLDEIASDYNITYVQIYEKLLTWVWNNIYDGVDIDLDRLTKVKDAGKKTPLILIPCHKSHMDYLLLSYVFYHNNLHPPQIAAGVNLTFFPMGLIFRKGGAFFIRRTFKGDPLYPIVFSTYIKTLLTEGFIIEFFIEGGRSRTGKLVMPKLGLLSIIMNAYFSGEVDDISFVPIFIGYDKVMEESSYIREISGAEKEKENLKSMIKSRGLLKKRYGRVYIDFNDPISLKEFCESSGYNTGTITKAEIRQLQYDLAYRIVYSINEVSVITPLNLVSAAFMSRLHGALIWEELTDMVAFFLDYLASLDARFSNTLRRYEIATGEALANLMEEKLVLELKGESEEEDFEKVFYVPEEKRFNLEFYKNNILHFFLPAAFVSTSILSRRGTGATLDQINEDYTYLRKLFKFDFIYDLKFSDTERINQVIDYLLENEIVKNKNGVIKVINDEEDKLAIFSGLIRNYLESYLVTLMSLPGYIEGDFKSEKDLLKRITRVGEKMYKRGEITRMESLSRMNFKNALSLLTHENTITVTERKEGKRRIKYYTLGPERKGYIARLRRLLFRIDQ